MKPFDFALRLTARLAPLAALPVVCVAMALGIVLVQRCRAQSSVPHIPTLPQSMGQPVGGSVGDFPQEGPPQDERLLRALNANRQKSLVSDTNRLLRLAKELNADIARTNPDALTPDQLRKMAEIEKLAHSVKEKMSRSVRAMPGFLPLMQPVH